MSASDCPFLQKQILFSGWRHFNRLARTLERLGIVKNMQLDGWIDLTLELNDEEMIDIERVVVDVEVGDVSETYLISEKRLKIDISE